MLLRTRPRTKRPLEKAGELGCVCLCVCRRNCPKAKDSSVLPRVEKPRRELKEPTLGADFYYPAQDINLPYELMSGDARFMSAPIIRIIKSFRKKN